MGRRSSQHLNQLLSGFSQLVIADWRKSVHDEQNTFGAIAQCCSWPLSPIPTAACHAGIVAPDDFAYLRSLCGCFATHVHREFLLASRNDQLCGTTVLVEIFTSEWDLPLDRDRVVYVGQPVDTGKAGLSASCQSLQAVSIFVWLRTEGFVSLSPRRNMRKVGHWSCSKLLVS
jgi:hypothetical protein